MLGTFSRILITGGTGSLGHALTRFLLAQTQATICILSRDEYKQFLMRQEFGETRLRYFLGDVRDLRRLLLATHNVDLVIHAAALKYVDVAEYNPSEFIATNIQGTQNVVDACRENSVHRAVFISSDKAVEPTTLYGSTKLTGERLWCCANAYTPQTTEYVSVRWANVAGSRGSVIPKWRAQLAREACPTLTSKDMSRFWITLEDAVALVWWAAHYAARGSTLVPYLPAYDVVDLLAAVCAEAGLSHTDTDDIGLRPAEKLAEVLMTNDEMDRAVLYHAAQERLYYSIPPLVPSWALPTGSEPQHHAGEEPWSTVGLKPYRSDVWHWRLRGEELVTRLREVP